MVEFITGSEFEVYFDDKKINFARVTNVSSQIEYEAYAEGGLNDSVLLFRKPKQSPDTIVFEKGQCADSSGSFFSSIKKGAVLNNVMIYVKHSGENIRALCFNSGLVLSKELSRIDAMSNEILIERMEIAHSGLEEISV